MAWIESHTNLDRHTKLIRLQAAMRWSRNETVGFLHRFWWSVLDVSPTGDVTALTSPEVMSGMLNMSLDLAKEAIRNMEAVGFLERRGGTLLVHNWLRYTGRYLSDSLYRRHPEKMQTVREIHANKPQSVPSSDSRRIVGHTVPDRTLPKNRENKGLERSDRTIVAVAPRLELVQARQKNGNGNNLSPPDNQPHELLDRVVEFADDEHSRAFYQKALNVLGPGLLEEAMGEVKMREGTGELTGRRARAKYLGAVLIDWMENRGL